MLVAVLSSSGMYRNDPMKWVMPSLPASVTSFHKSSNCGVSQEYSRCYTGIMNWVLSAPSRSRNLACVARMIGLLLMWCLGSMVLRGGVNGVTAVSHGGLISSAVQTFRQISVCCAPLVSYRELLAVVHGILPAVTLS